MCFTKKIRLEKSCDEEGVHALQEQLKNAIFHAKVRISEQGFELLELIENDCSEPQLEALRGADAPQANVRMSEEEDAEVAEVLCIQTFAKARTRVYFEGKQEEGIRILHAMQKRQVGWYNDAVNYAADKSRAEIQRRAAQRGEEADQEGVQGTGPPAEDRDQRQ
ncbi:MAG: hypothetical protein V8T10_04155 [Merdibacter sp.]